jgi:hypothetical protein
VPTCDDNAMNDLIEVLASQPDQLGPMIANAGGRVSARELATALPQLDDVFDLLVPDRDARSGWYHYSVRHPASSLYLPVLSTAEWDSVWAAAAESHRSKDAEAWVSFLAFPAAAAGVLLPDDTVKAPHISLFTATSPDSSRAVSLTRRGESYQGSVVSAGHCGLPERGICQPGCGSCHPVRRYAEPPGIVCLCDHI